MLFFDQLKKSDYALRMVSICIAGGLFILLSSLWYLQIVSAKHYEESHIDQSFRTVRIPAVRGKILDRNGIPLAENRATYNLSLYLDELRKSFQAEYKRIHTIARQQPSDETPKLSRWDGFLAKLGIHKEPVVQPRKLTTADRLKLGRQARYNTVSNVVQQLGSVLNEPLTIDETTFHKHYEQKLALPLPVLENLNLRQIARFEENAINPVGIDIETQPIRVYPNNQSAAHILGHLVRNNDSATNEDAFFNYRLPDFRGDIGIEGFFDAQLRGKAGVKSVLVNPLGYRQSESIWTPAEAGKNVVLTIDAPLQLVAEKALQTVSGNDVRGAAIVLNVSNGDILAMVSNPAYNPNQFVQGISHEDFARLNDEKFTPQLNRASQGMYQPGSIFKIVTGLAALEAGVLDPDEIYHNLGYYKLGRSSPIKDLAAPGDYDFRRAFLKSSNSYFIEYGLRAKFEKIMDLGNRFFFGELADIPTRQDKKGFFPTREWLQEERARGQYWSDGDTANVCIGQGQLTVTPVQMAVMTATIANGGKVFWPRLVQRLESQESLPNEAPIEEFPTRLRGELGVKARNLEIMREAMLADTEDPEGTAFAAFHEKDRKTLRLKNFRVGGKTGTAEVKKGNRVIDHITWFVSFAPFESPRYAVVVMVVSGSSGGGTCAPVAEKIYREIQKRELGAKPKNQVVKL